MSISVLKRVYLHEFILGRPYPTYTRRNYNIAFLGGKVIMMFFCERELYESP